MTVEVPGQSCTRLPDVRFDGLYSSGRNPFRRVQREGDARSTGKQAQCCRRWVDAPRFSNPSLNSKGRLATGKLPRIFPRRAANLVGMRFLG